jgi:hypothetical protein
MTPTALLILQLCAAHATQVPIEHPWGDIVLMPATYGSGQSTYTKYDPGFDDCSAVVPELTRQKQVEEFAAEEAKYEAQHVAEIKDLQKALDKLHKEQPNIQVRAMSLACAHGKGCGTSSAPIFVGTGVIDTQPK